MTKSTFNHAKVVFEVIAAHLAGKRTELTIALEQGRGVEGWLQHESVVALDNAYRGDLAGRIYTVTREGLRHEDAPNFDPTSRRRPFDLVFDEAQMVASLKLYMPWQSVGEATKDIRRDLIELRDHPHHGFLIAGRLDFRDGLTSQGRERRVKIGNDWLTDAVRSARDGLKLKSLVASDLDDSAQSLQIDLHPMEWTWPDGREVYRHALLSLGAWSVYKPSSS
jgi:hypothetical protein